MDKINTFYKFFLVVISGLINIETALANNEKFVISYVDHETIIKYYVPLLDAAYRSIGIEPEFVMINDKRALKLLNSGEIDADTAKTLEIINEYTNIIKVPTAISNIEVRLICQEKMLCDLSVLDDPGKVLGVIGANEFYTNLLQHARISIVELNSFDILLKMFEQKKIDFAFAVFDEHSLSTQAKFKNSFLIETKKGYHLLNKKHSQLIPKLELAIKDALTKVKLVKSDDY